MSEPNEDVDDGQPKRKCVICKDGRLAEIENLLRTPRNERRISREFGYSTNTIRRHREHMSPNSFGNVADLDGLARIEQEAEKILRTTKVEKVRLDALSLLRGVQTDRIRLSQGETSEKALTAHPAWQLFLKRLLGIVNDCAKCKEAIVGVVPGDTRGE